MHVKYSYLEEQFKDYQNIFKKIAEVVKTGDFTLGKAVQEFEEKFANLLGAGYGVGVNSGTDALFLSLKVIGVGPGDEVITAPNTFIATVGAIVASGARPVFVDVTDEYVINPDLIGKAITSRTKAIMPVHYAGVPADMDQIMVIADRHGVPVIEDACQAISASLNGKCAGTFGTAGGFSLHPLKNLNVWGDSGIIITNSEAIRDRLVLLRNHGLRNRDEVDFFGYNSRLDSVQAVVGNHLIKDINWITETRIKWAQEFDSALEELSEWITVPKRRPNKRYVHHLYMIKAKDRDKLLNFLNQNGIEAKVHYPIPLHLQRCSSHLAYQEGDFPVTEAQAKSIITLPVHQHLKEEQVHYMIGKMKEFYKKYGRYESKISGSSKAV
jgi:aminotransferase EvaB